MIEATSTGRVLESGVDSAATSRLYENYRYSTESYRTKVDRTKQRNKSEYDCDQSYQTKRTITSDVTNENRMQDRTIDN